MLWSDFPPSHVLVSASNYVQRLKKAFCDNELQKVEEIFLEFVIKLSFEKDNWTGEQLKTRGGAKFSTPPSCSFLSLIFTLCLDCKTLLLIQFSSGRCVGRPRLQIWLFLGMLTVDLLSMPFEVWTGAGQHSELLS